MIIHQIVSGSLLCQCCGKKEMLHLLKQQAAGKCERIILNSNLSNELDFGVKYLDPVTDQN